jgi:hypothetical protein
VAGVPAGLALGFDVGGFVHFLTSKNANAKLPIQYATKQNTESESHAATQKLCQLSSTPFSSIGVILTSAPRNWRAEWVMPMVYLIELFLFFFVPVARINLVFEDQVQVLANALHLRFA